MRRRELFRILGAGATLPVFSPELLAFFQQALPAAGYVLRTLDPRQNDLVVAMIDQMIPVTDTPGAKAARVNEFIDVILTDWATAEERRMFLEGLSGVDRQSRELFGKRFVEASDAQQVALLSALEDAMMAERSRRPRRAYNPERNRDLQLTGDFFEVFKGITLHGYYTSAIGSSQELKQEMIPGVFHGCAPAPSGKKD